MANVDKRWWWLSLPVVLVLAFSCCCGGGVLLYFLIPAGDKVVFTSNAPEGDIRLDVTEHKRSGALTYDLALIDRTSNHALGGNSAHLTAEKQVQWSAQWLSGTCVVTSSQGGAWIGSNTKGKQSWLSFDSK